MDFGPGFSVELRPTYGLSGVTSVPDTALNVEVDLKVWTLEIPLFLKWTLHRSVNPYVLAGGFVGFSLDRSLELRWGGVEYVGSGSNILRRMNLGVGFGGGAEIALSESARLCAEALYMMGRKDLSASGTSMVGGGTGEEVEITMVAGDDVRTRDLRISVGLSYSLGR